MSAEVERSGDRGTYGFSLGSAWKDPSGSHQRVTQLGSVEAIGWTTRAAPAIDILSGLALPLVLLFLAQRYKKAEQRREEVQQVWGQMLKKMHSHAESIYMPISTSLFGLQKEAASVRGKAGRDLRTQLHRVFCSLLICWRRQRELSKKIGGWYFKSRLGENTANESWHVLAVGADANLGAESLGHLIEALEPDDALVDVCDRLAPRTPPFALRLRAKEVKKEFRNREIAGQLGASFERWFNGDFTNYLNVLRVMELTIDFETNRPFVLWYGKREKFPEVEFRENASELAAWQARLEKKDSTAKLVGALKGLSATLEDYLRENSGGVLRRVAKRVRT